MSTRPILVLGLSVSLSCNLFMSVSAYGQVSLGQPMKAQLAPPSIPTREGHKRQTKSRAIEIDKEELLRETQILDSDKPKMSQKRSGPLQGSLTYVDLSQSMGEGVNKLTHSALERDAKYKEATRAVDHYSTKAQRSIRFAKDALNYAIPYRGFSMSIEGSRVILDKNQKLNNLCIAQLTKQKLLDEMHPKVVEHVMQIAMGLGLPNQEESQKTVQKGVQGLAALVGKDSADSTLAVMSEWNKQLNMSDAVFQQQPWDVDTRDRVYHQALVASEDGDALVDQIFKSVKKYNRGKLANFMGSLVESNLSAMTIMGANPLIGLTAEALNTAFVMGTGGPEENKILKELYYGRRVEIRRKRISDEVELALSNYEKAILTHNKPELAASEAVLAQLVGPDGLANILERDPVSDIASTAPIELAREAKK